MFAKLKKKIQEENGDVDRPAGPGMASPVNRTPASNRTLPQRMASVHSPGGASPNSKSAIGDQPTLKRADSVSSVNSSHEGSPAPVNSKEEVLAMLMKRTDQVKKLESKIGDYAATIKEKVKMIEKLEITLEKQTDASLKRVQEMNEQYQANRAKLSEGFTLALQKKEEEMNELVKKVEQEKSDVEQKLKQAESYKEKYYKNEQENDEFQGLTAQELAKVKHLLLNKEEELASCRKYLQEKMTMLETTSNNQTELENELKIIKNENQTLSECKAKGEAECEMLQNKVKKLQASVLELSSSYEEKSNRLVTLETSLNDMNNEHQKLERTSEVYKNKTVALLEEKDGHISHLEDRVKMLEQRIQDSELGGDEKSQALLAERSSLEQKLSEARQQLTEIKSSWSEKINHLEQQIAHLNTKIVEDNEELLNCQRSAEATRESLQKQVDSIRTSYEEVSKRASSHLETINEKEALLQKTMKEFEMEKSRQSQHAMDSDTELRAKIDALESEVMQLENLREGEKKRAEERISHLEAMEAEYLQKEIDHEHSVSQLETDCRQRVDTINRESREKMRLKEEEIEKLQAELSQKERECSTTLKILEETRQDSSQLRDKVLNSEQQMSGANDKMSQVNKQVQSLQDEVQSIGEERDGLLLRNAELSQHLQQLRQSGNESASDLQAEVKRMSESVCVSEQALVEKEQEIKDLQQKLQDMERSQTESENTVHKSEAQKYEKLSSDLEAQLTEKNKTIKMLQQRLGDLKKTLQRELKVQALPNDDHDASRELEVARLSVSNSDTMDGSTHSQKHSTAARNSTTQHLNVHMGASEGRFMNSDDMKDVNFEYLKHVVLKFMLSRESEAIHLIKAVSMLLDFTPDEEKLIKQNLEYKMSWFGRAPRTGKGQKTRTIPPSY